MTIRESIARQDAEDAALRAPWALLGKYASIACPNCRRYRLCYCANGMHRCEKCNWVPELGTYCPVGN